MKRKIILLCIFTTTLLFIIGLFSNALVRTNKYNSASHNLELKGEELFTSSPEKRDVTINSTHRDDTWGKIFDFNNEGITENNYHAYTYDFNVHNNTQYEVREFSFKLFFDKEVYLFSAWNGSLEIHQNVNDNEIVETIPDLRSYDPSGYKLDIYNVDGVGNLVKMNPGDYIKYIPSHSSNALEMPIKSKEGTTPGIIMYIENGVDIENSKLVLDYKLFRSFTEDPFFIASMICLLIWGVFLTIILATDFQVRKYKLRHERDYKIINESIETFTGFIDAKDSYTNGHSKRVAIYTKLIAEKMGFQGEELDRIYYIALLHDCGKIGVPDNILGKPGRLTDEEFEIIKSHTVRGGEILLNFKSLDNAHEGALHHHERYDGNGYPDKLKGEDIPLIARMICVADSFDAMNSSRVYRNKLSKEYIINELEKNKGSQFDPKIADIMLELIKEGNIKIE